MNYREFLKEIPDIYGVPKYDKKCKMANRI